MREESADLVIIGAGIVGLGIAKAWAESNPSDRILVIDKESALAQHASGRNSGVLHAGFYYAPDSLKAQLTRTGNAALRAFCQEMNVPVRQTGKVVVTREPSELPALMELYRRGVANGCELEIVDEDQLCELEPLASTCGQALWSPLTAVADPVRVTEALGAYVGGLGVRLRLNTEVVGASPSYLTLRSGERINFGHVINAAGLYADTIAHWMDVGNVFQILPFKGLYLYDSSGAVPLTRQVYPVPDARNPFLGVHVTVTVSGRVKIGPTAIPALKREDYGKPWEVDSSELRDIARVYPRFLTSPHHNVFGLIASEVPKYSHRYLTRLATKLVPSLKMARFDERGRPGVRAQLLNLRTKKLEMDFVVRSGRNSTHMLNVVSPAWTSSLAVGEYTVAGIQSGRI